MVCAGNWGWQCMKEYPFMPFWHPVDCGLFGSFQNEAGRDLCLNGTVFLSSEDDLEDFSSDSMSDCLNKGSINTKSAVTFTSTFGAFSCSSLCVSSSFSVFVLRSETLVSDSVAIEKVADDEQESDVGTTYSHSTPTVLPKVRFLPGSLNLLELSLCSFGWRCSNDEVHLLTAWIAFVLRQWYCSSLFLTYDCCLTEAVPGGGYVGPPKLLSGWDELVKCCNCFCKYFLWSTARLQEADLSREALILSPAKFTKLRSDLTSSLLSMVKFSSSSEHSSSGCGNVWWWSPVFVSNDLFPTKSFAFSKRDSSITHSKPYTGNLETRLQVTKTSLSMNVHNLS